MARPTYTGGRTVYDGQHAVTGQRQTYTGQSTQSAPPEPQGKQRGFLGSVGHFVADKTERAARDIKGIPIGIAQVVEAPVKDTYQGVKAIPSIIAHPGRQHGAEKAGKSSTAVAKSVAETTKTAVQHPLRDPFLTVTSLLPVANTIARGGELAAGADVAAPRVLKAGGKETPLIRSRGATGRVVQRGYDKVVQSALNKNEAGQATGRVVSRVAAHGQKRIGGALDEQARIAQRMRATPAQLLDQAAVKLAKLPGKRRVEQAALELTSVQNTPAEAIRYHVAQARAGVNPKQNLAVAKLYKKVAGRDLVHLDESKPAGEKVFINPAHEHLVRTDEALANVQAGGDRALVDRGVRSAEALQSRTDAPGRVRAGATYEKPTPGKQGVVSKTMKREQQRLVSLERRHAAALAKESDWVKTRKQEIQKLTARESVPADAATADAIKSDARYYDYRTGRPQISSWGRAQLRAIKSETRPSTTGGKSVALDNPHRERIVTLGHALDEQRTKVSQMEKAAAARVTPTGLVGGTTARPGRGFVSERVSERKLSGAERGGKRGPVVGTTAEPITKKTYTGRALAQGLRPKDVTGAASRHFRQIMRFQNTEDRVSAAVQTGSQVRRSARDILVRTDKNAKPISHEVAQALGKETSNVDTAEELATTEGLRAAHQVLVDRILGRGDPEADASRYSIGMKTPDGYTWVDQHALGDILKQQPGPRGRLAKTVDTINSAITAATVYFKVGHIGTRVLTNAVTNIIQGSARPEELGKGAEMWNAISDEQRARALAASGQHGFAALPHEGTNMVARIASKGAGWWARHADAPFRFNSIRYELAKVGYDTPEKFVKALDALENHGAGMPSNEWAKLSAAARRADREGISYDRLNEFEKRYLTRAVWFYPWIKGSTMFTVRTAIEHPYKAGALGVLGAHGRQVQQQTLGDTPTYEAGLMALTGGQNPLTTDFSTFSPFSTAADVLEAPVQPGAAAGFLNPVAGASGQFLYGLNQYGGTSQSPYLDALRSVAAATPEQQLAEAFAAAHADQSGKMFPKSPGGTGLRYLIGPATPRRVNVSALAKAAARQRSGQR